MEHYKHIHFVGLGGVAMGNLALSLKEKNSNIKISGSDGMLYEPMKSKIMASSIEYIQGYMGETAEKLEPDLVVFGNVVSKDNPEVIGWIQKGVSFLSFPSALRHFIIRHNKSLLATGTHGKTTTSSALVHVMKDMGLTPAYFIGGVNEQWALSCSQGLSEAIEDGHSKTGGWFIGEGDEYDSAFFDKGPKFLHYAPYGVIILNIEFDHADIYKDKAHIERSFQKLLILLPGDGVCVCHAEQGVVQGGTPLSLLQSYARVPIFSYGLMGSDWVVQNIRDGKDGSLFDVEHKGIVSRDFMTPLLGTHNILNLTSILVLLSELGFSHEKIKKGFLSFKGVKRRQECLLQKPYIFDDFAHHPTEIQSTLQAIQSRFGGGKKKIIALFEARSNTAQMNIHQDTYPEAFDTADVVLLRCLPQKKSHLSSHKPLSYPELEKTLIRKGILCHTFDSDEAMMEYIKVELPKELGHGTNIGNDCIFVCMSNGDFRGFPYTLKKYYEADYSHSSST